MISLAFWATVINYLDRQTLSVAAPVLREQFHMSNVEYSRVVFAFMLAYTIMNGVSGSADRPAGDARSATRCAWRGGRPPRCCTRSRAAPGAWASSASCWAWARRATGRRRESGGRMVPGTGARAGLRHLQQRLVGGRDPGAAAGRVDPAHARLAVRLSRRRGGRVSRGCRSGGRSTTRPRRCRRRAAQHAASVPGLDAAAHPLRLELHARPRSSWIRSGTSTSSGSRNT